MIRRSYGANPATSRTTSRRHSCSAAKSTGERVQSSCEKATENSSGTLAARLGGRGGANGVCTLKPGSTRASATESATLDARSPPAAACDELGSLDAQRRLQRGLERLGDPLERLGHRRARRRRGRRCGAKRAIQVAQRAVGGGAAWRGRAAEDCAAAAVDESARGAEQSGKHRSERHSEKWIGAIAAARARAITLDGRSA